jgi:hypothetical protein
VMASVSVEGDWDKLRRTISSLDRVASKRLMSPLTEVAEQGVQEQYHLDFTAQKDPWGARWEPTKKGTTPILYKSGNLAGAEATSTTGTVRIRPPHYWVFHQMGARGAPQRAVLPFGVSDWNPPIQKKLEEVIFDNFPTRD